MNFYAFHIGDYAVHTRHLTPMEDLAYRRLLDLYYTRESGFPSGTEEIARRIGLRDCVEEVATVLNEFFILQGDTWISKRCDEEIDKFKDKQEKAKASAQASVNARSTNAQRTLTDRLATNPNPITSKEITPPTPSGGAFDTFWKEWPAHQRKVARSQCQKKWETKGCEAIHARVIAALDAAKRSDLWAKNNGEFIPAPLTWLNQARWEGMEEAAEAWHEGKAGVLAKAKELGMPKWDEIEQWVFYKARVIQAAQRVA